LNDPRDGGWRLSEEMTGFDEDTFRGEPGSPNGRQPRHDSDVVGVTSIEGCDDDPGVEQNATLRHLRRSLTAEARARLASRPAGTFLLEMLPSR
jgi:hypothetical protein